MSLREKYVKAARRQSSNNVDSFTSRWKSPSNIALIKYWGKHGNQLPINPSVSLTLSECATDTTCQWVRKKGPSNAIDLTFSFHGNPAPTFEKRIKSYLESITDLCPFIHDYNLAIDSSNSFPHSAGIASSASGFSALALSLTSMEDELYEDLDDDDDYRTKASYLARLGSGSACRSIYGKAAWWGKSHLIEESTDEYAIDFSGDIHDDFKSMRDSILIVSSGEKPVSSSRGHHLMEFHPYRHDRIEQVNLHLKDMKVALRTGDLERFGQIIEQEALSLHALMMTSTPGYFLVTGKSIDLINSIRAFRESESVPCYFTLDAGPNIHLLYPKKFENPVMEFIESLDSDTDVLHDQVGVGPVQLK